jgi:hypothetical protein
MEEHAFFQQKRRNSASHKNATTARQNGKKGM